MNTVKAKFNKAVLVFIGILIGIVAGMAMTPAIAGEQPFLELQGKQVIGRSIVADATIKKWVDTQNGYTIYTAQYLESISISAVKP
jgi:hypothetical protein